MQKNKRKQEGCKTTSKLLKQKKSAKEIKGITLIALVVTIVVLLILAGVSINLVIGNNGIINKAGEAKEKTGTAKEKEMIQLAYQAAYTQDNTNTDPAKTFANFFAEELANNGLTGVNIEDKGNGKYTVTLQNQNKYSIDENEIKQKTDVEEIEFYIHTNFGVDTYKVEKDTTWKQFIIAENPEDGGEDSPGQLFTVNEDGEIDVCTFKFSICDESSIGAILVLGGGPLYIEDNGGSAAEGPYVYPDDKIIEGYTYNCEK